MTASRPLNHSAQGGIAITQSSVSSARIFSTSADSQASMKRSTISRTRSSPSSPIVSCWLCSGRSSSVAFRALCRAL